MSLPIPWIVRMLKDSQAWSTALFIQRKDTSPAYGCPLKEMDIVSGDVTTCQFRVASVAKGFPLKAHKT